MGRVDGKVALVSGAGRGMGRAVCIRLAEEGADVVAVDICRDIDTANTSMAGSDDLDETVSLVEALGGRVVAVHADVREQDQVDHAVAVALERFARLDTIVANAAITSFGTTWELTEEAWRAVLDVNLTGTWHTAKAAIPALIEAGNGGSIVFVNSVNGLKSGAGIGHYVASKHGAVGLMRTLASELGVHAIRVNTVHPTLVTTGMVVNAASLRRYFPHDPDATVADLGERMRGRHAIPVPWVDAVDIANAVLWLASDEARYVTGATIPVDAGLLVK